MRRSVDGLLGPGTSSQPVFPVLRHTAGIDHLLNRPYELFGLSGDGDRYRALNSDFISHQRKGLVMSNRGQHSVRMMLYYHVRDYSIFLHSLIGPEIF